MGSVIRSLPLLLAACATAAVACPPAAAPGAASPEGRWTIAAVEGRPVRGLWIALGGEGIGTVTRAGDGLRVASPQPPSRAYLGCNDWHPNGWARDGNTLTMGVEMSHRTERGCDAARMTLDDAALAILMAPMAIAFDGSGRLRLSNARGTLDLVRETP